MAGVLARYEQSEFARENEALLRDLRLALRVDPLRYRGIARDPLRPLRASQLPLVKPENFEARVRMGQLCDEDDLLPDAATAREVAGLLEDAGDFEIIGPGGAPLGLDIASDQYSVIADVAVTPRWHPPHPDDFRTLASHLRDLNENLLFSTPEDAERFLAYYRSRDWAESAGDLTILAVSLVA
jgi:hypothetical protein